MYSFTHLSALIPKVTMKRKKKEEGRKKKINNPERKNKVNHTHPAMKIMTYSNSLVILAI